MDPILLAWRVSGVLRIQAVSMKRVNWMAVALAALAGVRVVTLLLPRPGMSISASQTTRPKDAETVSHSCPNGSRNDSGCRSCSKLSARSASSDT